MRLVLAGGTYAPLRLMAGTDAGDESAGRAGVPPMATPHGFTERQFAVLRLLARGLPNKLIARELKVSESTVKVHLLAIFRALEVHNRTHAVVQPKKNSGPTAMRPKRPECQGAGARSGNGQRAASTRAASGRAVHGRPAFFQPLTERRPSGPTSPSKPSTTLIVCV